MTPEDTSDFRDGVPFLGGALWIDLLNTTPVIDGQALDLIGDAALLQRWAGLAGLGPDTRAEDALGPTKALRSALRVTFEALAEGKPLPPPTLATVNAALTATRTGREIVQDAGAPVVAVRATVTGPVVAAQAAVDLADFLRDYEPARLRHCSNPDCTMVFYDRGKNNRRRWCSMQACGNRDKVARYRARKAAQTEG